MLLPQSGRPGRITPAQAHRAVEDGSALLADIREEDEFRAGHAPGAMFWPLSRLAEGPGLPGSEDGRDLVLICRFGNRSQQAARLLAERGVAAVDVTGGMIAWAAQGLPVQDVHGAAGTVI
ncbi:rhodanese-like domain-containing protein [Streptomyces sp. NPDC057963]|uniref:rhodanese-like domain-containing protein n=1 Tax=Streptomyces sp. NPDC057963 TaxID=3346290 RepID=UPI0036E3D6F2